MPHKLLLADDSVTIQRVIELTFADEDVQLTAVGDGRLAIERIEADPPDIVLADVGMPEKDGYEVAAFIKSNPRLAHIPVLLLTGAFEPVDEDRARAAGCDGVLAKPFEPQMVITRVKELLAEASRPTPLHRGAPPAVLQAAVAPAPVVAIEAVPVPPPVAIEPPAVDATAMTFVPTMLTSEAAVGDADTAADAPFVIESPMDAAIRIRRRQTLTVPEFGVPPLETPLSAATPDVDSEADTPVPGRRGELDDYFRQLEAPFGRAPEARDVLPPVVMETAFPVQEPVPAQTATDPTLDLSWAPPSPDRPAAPVVPDALFAPAPTVPFDPFAGFPAPEPQPVFEPAEEVGAPPAVEAPIAPAAPVFAQAFSALLAAESGDGDAGLPFFAAAPAPAPAIDVDVLAARVTRQVLEQLTDRVVRETVADIVSKVAERLVREEIERIRASIR